VQHVGGAKLLAFDKYRKRAKKRARGTTVALVVATGPVQLGRSGGYDPLTRGASMGSDTVARALRDAGGDKRVKAVLFRVDSPGGSYVASDTIWRETVRLRERGKPVVVSMGNVAGSGGYFVAMAANRIVAQPGTITGSIGVLGGKLVTTGLREKAGLSIDEVHTSEHARLYSAAFDYSASELQRVDAFLDRVYLDFTTKVASGRHKERADVHEVARGRIWTGEQAIGHGLVDALGGYPAALRAVREVAGLAPDAPVRLKQFPGRSPLARLRAQRSERSRPDLAASARSLAHGLGITDAGALSVPVHLLPRW
jgi:protease-4